MRISELGEFGLIDLVSKVTGFGQGNKFPAQPGIPELVVGIGDDTAVWRAEDVLELATTDTLVQNVHFSFDYVTWRELGWKSLAVNMSDIASMGGLAAYALVTLGLPQDTEVQAIVDLYKGMAEVGDAEGVRIIGGDMVSSPVVFITVALTGVASNDTGGQIVPLLRSKAQAGDLIAVTGTLGSSTAGLRMLAERTPLDSTSQSYLRKAHLTPVPRMVEGRALVKAGIKTCMDISDGLVIDLDKICKASGVGASIYIEKIPIDPVARLFSPNDCLKFALSGGEDYELLFTGSKEQVEDVHKMVETPVTIIGEIVTDQLHRVSLIDEHGKERALPKTGWDHFTAK